MEKKKDQKDIEAQIADIFTRGVGTFVDPGGIFKKKLIAKATGKYSKEIIIKFGVDPTRPDIHLGHAVVLRKLRQLQDLGCKVVFLVGDFTAQIGDPTGKSKMRPEISQEEISCNMGTYIKQVPKILKIEPTKEEKNEKVARDALGSVVDSPWFSWMRNSEWFTAVTDVTKKGASDQALTVTNKETNQKVVLKFPANSFFGKSVIYENSRMQKVFLKKTEVKTVSVINLFSILRKISYAQLVERDLFQERIKNNEPFFMHEMLYPVIQGIDSDIVAQIYGSCDLEVGGTDQTFNMLMGRKVMELTKKEPQAVAAFDILVGLDGKEKMSKSLDNYVGIADVPNEMFGKIMSIPDSVISSYFELCTFTAMTEVKELEKKLVGGKVNPRDVKMDLAQQIVEIYHGRAKAEGARTAFISTFQNKELPENMREAKVAKGMLLVDVLIDLGILDSKNEFRRLLGEGAIRKNGKEKLTDPATKVEENIVLKIGKHRFVKMVVE
ncbi:MAG: tyrosine--tRNA ligase [Patescibacteria group bacterium]